MYKYIGATGLQAPGRLSVSEITEVKKIFSKNGFHERKLIVSLK
jgi:hypothetical protein